MEHPSIHMYTVIHNLSHEHEVQMYSVISSFSLEAEQGPNPK